MLLDTRRQRIVDVLKDNGPLSIERIVEIVGVSPSTVRRDVATLSEAGLLRRIRGGAEFRPPASAAMARPRVFDQVVDVNAANKERIARAAAGMVENGQTVIIANGTTTFRMARHVAHMDIQVVTFSLPVIRELEGGTCGVIVPGGLLYRDQAAILAAGDDSFADLSAVTFFAGAHSFDRFGSREMDPLLVSTERRMAGRARQTVLLVDSSKFAEPSGLLSLTAADIDVVVTDADAPEEARRMVRDAGCRLVIA